MITKGALVSIAVCFLCFFGTVAMAQKTVELPTNAPEYIFTFGEVECLEDPSGQLTFDEVRSGKFDKQFVANHLKYPKNNHVSSAYWYRVKVKYPGAAHSSYLLEFYDQTIDDITAWLPDNKSNYSAVRSGAEFDFDKRLFSHKNFQFIVPATHKGVYTFYFRIKSAQTVNVIIVHRSVQRFIGYALTEYFSFGLFYGMIIIFSFYNLLMYSVMRQRQYIYYVLYIISVGLYEMSADGIAFQYLWSDSPRWNEYAYAIPLFLLSTFALLFTLELLHVKVKARRLYKLILIVLFVRFAFFLLCALYDHNWFNYRIVEFIPLTVAFYTGFHIWRKGYKPARFFVLAYTFLFIGFVLKVLVVLGYGRFIPGWIAHYSMSFCFIAEMLLLSFAIGDKVRLLKKKKEKAQVKIIKQMEENARLKDTMNRKLEVKVKERTHEIVEKTKEIRKKSLIIEQQNVELHSANQLLKQQAEEIARMNVLLQKDNQELQTNIKKVTHDRIMSTEVDFEEFSKTYPDRDACFSLLADLKWKSGFVCRKCGNTNFCGGHLPYSRRCTKCRYDESVIANTILQNSRIPVNKAFYMIFLIYSTKGRISSHRLSEITGIRQSTCWMYSSKIKKVLNERKKELRKAGEQGWSKLVLE
ncbi:7TM diverse intracellular signaling domain-containing protein [Arcticibacter tournemirensis]|uniref:Chromosome partitioning protein ParA n=1 Tax=Arcticibacter tournemirensis TaxID=699437 RepID=A0A4V1KIM8_9SPHI|nr:7TM diverse intracellular signaling domain-containing protein [Arcticibacter tournemirensis]RXF71242.1 chromosome partitioning protein ParA [Arcticibacter tournemirensis]